MKGYVLTLVAVLSLLLISCKSQTAAYHTYTTECMGMNLDGKQTIRVWATGNSRGDAIRQAKKKAVDEVTFRGIAAGTAGCNTRPIVIEANAREKYEDYFDKFFSDNGPYEQYVEFSNHRLKARDRFKSGIGTFTYGINVVVNTSALRQRYKGDGIIK